MEESSGIFWQALKKADSWLTFKKLMIFWAIMIEVVSIKVSSDSMREENTRKYGTFEDVHGLMHAGRLSMVTVEAEGRRYEVTHGNGTIIFARIEQNDTLSFSLSGIPSETNPIRLRASGTPAYEVKLIPRLGDGLKNVEPEFLRVALVVREELAKRYRNQPQSSLLPQGNGRSWMMPRSADFARPSVAQSRGRQLRLPQKI